MRLEYLYIYLAFILSLRVLLFSSYGYGTYSVRYMPKDLLLEDANINDTEFLIVDYT